MNLLKVVLIAEQTKGTMIPYWVAEKLIMICEHNVQLIFVTSFYCSCYSFQLVSIRKTDNLKLVRQESDVNF